MPPPVRTLAFHEPPSLRDLRQRHPRCAVRRCLPLEGLGDAVGEVAGGMAGSRSRLERSSRSSSFRRALLSHLTSGHATFPSKRRRGCGKRGFDRAGGQAHTARSVSPRTRIDAGSGPVSAALSSPFSASIEQVAFPKPAQVAPRKHRPGQLAVQVLLDDDGRGRRWTAMRRSAAGIRRRRCACPSSPAARSRRERREFREPFPPVRRIVDDRRTCRSA